MVYGHLGIHQGRVWNGAGCGAEPVQGPVCPWGQGCHCPLHSCGTCPPLCPCCSCRLASEKRTHPAHVRATGCCCHEHCEVGNYCAGFSSCPAAGQTSVCHEAGWASLAFCKQTSLAVLAELCSGWFVLSQALFWRHWPVAMFPACLEVLAPALAGLSATPSSFFWGVCVSHQM